MEWWSGTTVQPPAFQVTRLSGAFPNRTYLLDQISSDGNGCPNQSSMFWDNYGFHPKKLTQQSKGFPHLWFPLLYLLVPATVILAPYPQVHLRCNKNVTTMNNHFLWYWLYAKKKKTGCFSSYKSVLFLKNFSINDEDKETSLFTWWTAHGQRASKSLSQDNIWKWIKSKLVLKL